MTDIVTHLDDAAMIDKEGYLEWQRNNAESAYAFNKWNKPESYQDWDKVTWYIMPELMNSA